jgi:hypothetical protein
MSIPTAYATLSNAIPGKPYILSITPLPSSSHLILRHPSSDLTIVDNQTLQAVDKFAGGHDGNVMDVKADGVVQKMLLLLDGMRGVEGPLPSSRVRALT